MAVRLLWTLRFTLFWSTYSAIHSFETSSLPWSTSTNFYTSGHVDEHKCQEKFTHYVYERNECDAPDVETYLKSNKEQYTCENRCGHIPVYGQNLRDCACDLLCVVYEDCCNDMPKVCAEIYSRASKTYSHLLPSVSSCQGFTDASDPFAVFMKFRLAEHSQTTESSTSVRQSQTITFSAPANSNSFPEPNTITLNKYLPSVGSFKVVDLAFGVVFDSYAAFHSRRVPGSRPRSIPKLVTLGCSGGPMRDLSSKSILRVLPWCQGVRTINAVTSFHRNCALSGTSVIACRCDNGGTFTDYTTRACQGHNNSMSFFDRHEYTIKRFGHSIVRGLGSNNNRECVITSVDRNIVLNSDNDRKSDIYVRMKVTPLFQINTHHFDQDVTGSGNNSFKNKEKVYGKEQETVDNLQSQSTEFVVELAETNERRLRCPRLRGPLSDCVLEECAKGSLLVMNSPGHGQFVGRSCFLPVRVAVLVPGAEPGVPLCTCMRVMVALRDLKMWEIKTDYNTYDHGRCLFRLTTLKEDQGAFGDHEIFDAFDKLDENFEELSTATNLIVGEQLKTSLHESRIVCSDNQIRDFQICFYPPVSEKSTQTAGDESVCMAFSENLGESLKNSHVDMRARNLMVFTIFLCWCITVTLL